MELVIFRLAALAAILRIAVLLSSDTQSSVYDVKIHKLRVYEGLNGLGVFVLFPQL